MGRTWRRELETLRNNMGRTWRKDLETGQNTIGRTWRQTSFRERERVE